MEGLAAAGSPASKSSYAAGRLSPVTLFDDPASWPEDDLIGASIGMDPWAIVEAYSKGAFPMPLDGQLVGWYSPLRRGILPLDGLRVSRSLRKSAQRYRITVDQAFPEVLERCGDPRRPHGWINRDIVEMYTLLHAHEIAHSVEAWDAEGRLAGGLYGVSLGGLFAGESMFHDPRWGRDASKAALIGLVARLTRAGAPGRLLDVQWRTDHLASLGVIEVSRCDYLSRLRVALQLSPPSWADPESA